MYAKQAVRPWKPTGIFGDVSAVKHIAPEVNSCRKEKDEGKGGHIRVQAPYFKPAVE